LEQKRAGRNAIFKEKGAFAQKGIFQGEHDLKSMERKTICAEKKRGGMRGGAVDEGQG